MRTTAAVSERRAARLARAPAEQVSLDEPFLARTTRRALRFRGAVLVAWLVLLIAGGLASTRLAPLLSNGFGVPGTDSARAATILERHFADRGDGQYLLVFSTRRPLDPQLRTELQRAIDRAARRVPSAHAGPVQAAGRHVLYDTVVSQLDLARAKAYTARLRSVLRLPRGIRGYVTGQAAIQHDLDPVFSSDLRHGELAIAIPAALVVLLLVLGLSAIVTLPLLFAGATIAATLGLVFVVAHATVMATYVTNFVELIGLALAIDYSLLVVYRFREELEREDAVDEAVVRTMTTAGRSVVFSGATVTLGLALLLFIPVPFVRSLGIGGFLIPVVSVAAATTLLPALLSLYGRRGSGRIRMTRTRRGGALGFWHWLARSIMRRPLLFLAGGSAVLLLAAAPALALHLTPGSADGVPQTLPSLRGFELLRGALGAGALSPTQIVIDSGRPGAAETAVDRDAIARLTTRLQADPEVAAVRELIEPTRRYAELVVIGRHEYGLQPAQRFVARLRAVIVPGARFPRGTRVLAGGLEQIGVSALRPLLLLQLFFLAAFLSVCLVAGPWRDANAILAVSAGMIGVAAMAVQNALVQISLTNTPTTAVMTTNVTHFMLDLGEALVGRDDAKVARARAHAMHTLPVIVGFTIGCVFGATFEAAAGLWSLTLPTGLAVLAFAMGFGERRRAS